MKKRRVVVAAVVVVALALAGMAAAMLRPAAGPRSLAGDVEAEQSIDSALLKTRPSVRGTFIQSELASTFTPADWDAHMKMLTEAGMDLLILQDIADTSGGVFGSVYFDSDFARAHAGADFVAHEAMLSDALTAAKARGIQIYVGSNFANEWWNNAFADEEWRDQQAQFGNHLAQEIYDQYKPEFGDTLAGWYWTWEMYSTTSSHSAEWSAMMNQNLDYYHGLDAGMPVLFSPFLSAAVGGNPSQTQKQWEDFLAATHLAPGDIFAPQDSYGGGDFTLQFVDQSLAGMKAAAETKPGLEFWVNVENFAAADDGLTSAPVARFVPQLRIAGQYADQLIAFSYSHYYNPLISEEQAQLDKEYREYLEGTRQ